MSFCDHVPIVGTIKRAAASWSGGEVSDYKKCQVTAEECSNLGEILAEQKCKKCISDLTNDYIRQLPSPSIIKDVLEILAGGVGGAVGWKLLAKAGTKTLGKILIGAGLVLAADAIVDVAIYFRRLFKIKDAAAKAKKQLCNCPES